MNLSRRALIKTAARAFIFPVPALALTARFCGAQAQGDPVSNVLALREHVAECIRRGQKDIWIKGHHRVSSEAIDRLGDTVIGWRGGTNKTLMQVPSGYRLIGDGPAASSLTLEGAASVNLVSIVDASSASVEGLGFVGNNRENSASFPGAIHLLATENATHDIGDFRFLDLQFENFKNAAWCQVENLGTKNLTDIAVKRNKAISRPGNLRGPAEIGADNDIWSFCGNVLNPAGLIRSVDVEDLVVQGAWAKCAISFWSCVRNARVNRLLAEDIGLHAQDNSAAYAVKIYSNHWYVNPPELWLDRRYFPDEIEVLDSTVLNARSAGVYFATGGRIIVRNSVFKGQNDRLNMTEPRGCIAGPGCIELICEGNSIENAFSGIDWFPEIDTNSSALIRNNRITGIRDDGIGIKVRPTTSSRRNGHVTIVDNYSHGTEPGCRGLFVQYSDKERFAQVNVISNIFRGDYADAEIYRQNTDDQIVFLNNSLLTGKFRLTNTT
jgi:hypothetical protein